MKIVHANFKSCKELRVVCALYAENGATLVAANLYLTRVIPSEYLKVCLLSIGALD